MPGTCRKRNEPSCRICLGGGNIHSRCSCGEASWFHDRCLLKWARARGPKCEICGSGYRGLRQRAYLCDLDTSKLDVLVFDLGGAVLLLYGLWSIEMWNIFRFMCGANFCLRAYLLAAHAMGVHSARVGPQGGAAWSIRAICYSVVPVPTS